MKKRVYLFDGVANSYNGFWDCQESPLELGVYIEPVFSTVIEPPTFDGAKHTCTWDGTNWVLTDKPLPTENELLAELDDLTAKIQPLGETL